MSVHRAEMKSKPKSQRESMNQSEENLLEKLKKMRPDMYRHIIALIKSFLK